MKQFQSILIIVLSLFLTPNVPAQVKAWGLNNRSQLGDGSQTNRNVPTNAFAGFTDITAFAGGGGHTLALRANGTILAVGSNNIGQLGDGTTTTIGGCNCKTTPVVVRNSTNTGALQNITAITAGVTFSLALDKDGTVWAWGYNFYGQLGNNSTNDSNLPKQVGAGISGFDGQVIAIASNSLHSLAITSDGKLWAWGRNLEGQIGDGTSGSGNVRLVPVKVQESAGVDFGSVLQVAAGQSHSTALRRDGTVWVWGSNFNRQLGDPSVAASNMLYPAHTFQNVMGGVAQIAAGDKHNVALTPAGEVWVWGDNTSAQLGNGSVMPDSVIEPTKNSSLANIIEIKAHGSPFMLVRNRSGQIFAWGYNGDGEIGNGTFSTTPPLAVTTPYSITSLGSGNAVIDTGAQHSLLSNPVIAAAAGTSQILRGENVRLKFADITSGGNVSYSAIDPTATGLTPPADYVISGNQPAYNITSTAATTGNIDVCLKVAGEFDRTAFALLKILHGEGSNLVDRTYTSSYIRRQICARVTSLSPFVIARGLAPTVSNISVSGKVTFSKGSRASRAKVSLTDAQGVVKTALVNPFGYYKFENVTVDQTVAVQVTAKGAVFNPQVIYISEDVEDLNFSSQ